MDSKHWTGDDNRDELAPDYEADCCPVCGVDADEPCESGCDCDHCKKATGTRDIVQTVNWRFRWTLK